eukprot:4267081-Pleurochrysis_carterae.AAC.1
MKNLFAALPERFDESHRAEWHLFLNDYPKSIDDIPAEDIDLFTANWLPPCSMQLTDASARLQDS